MVEEVNTKRALMLFTVDMRIPKTMDADVVRDHIALELEKIAKAAGQKVKVQSGTFD